MVAVNYSTLRENLKGYCDKATEENEAVIVTRKDNKNVVIVSLAAYNELDRAKRNLEYLEKLDRAFKQKEDGQFHEHELIEVDDEVEYAEDLD